jgi:hypothetical protein
MPIRFQSPAHADVLMLDEHAYKLIELMGHGGSVPGALAAVDLPEAIARLAAGIRADAEARAEAQAKPEEVDDHAWEQNDRQDASISLALRALPLQRILEAARVAGKHVMWDRA